MENLVTQNEKLDSVLEQLQEAVVSHANLVKKSSIRIDGYVSCIKNTNNYLFESFVDIQGQSLLKRYSLFTSVTMFNENREKANRDPANLVNSKLAKTNGSNETAKWATTSKVTDGFFASRLNYPNTKSAEPVNRNKSSGVRKEQNSELADLRAELNAVKKKAESRKESLKLLYKILTDKETTVDKLEKALGDTTALLQMITQQSIYLGEQFSEEVNKRLEEKSAKVESLQQLVENFERMCRGSLLEGSRQPQLSFGPEGVKEKGSIDLQINELNSRKISKEGDPVLKSNSGITDLENLVRIEQLNTELKLLQADKISLAQGLEDKEKNLHQMRVELSKNTDLLKQKTELIKSIEAQLAKSRSEVQGLTIEKSDLVSKLHNSQENLKSLQKELQVFEAKISSEEVERNYYRK